MFPGEDTLYPLKELQVLELADELEDKLFESKEKDLEEEAAKYEAERYHPGWRTPAAKLKILKQLPRWPLLLHLIQRESASSPFVHRRHAMPSGKCFPSSRRIMLSVVITPSIIRKLKSWQSESELIKLPLIIPCPR